MIDITYKKNSIWKNNNLFNNTKTIDGYTIIVESMHYCYSHAIMDFIFPLFWIIKDIKNKYNTNIHINKFNIFIKIPKHSLNFKIIENNNYKGIFNELINLLELDNIIFEHKLENNIKFENAFYINSNDEWISSWQRGVWNCSKYYPQRNFNIKDVYYNDNIIYQNLKDFVLFTKKKLNIKNYNTKNNMIIIERKFDRKFDTNKLNNIISIINDKYNFNGVKILEYMTLKEQIDLFSKNNIFISS